ncbi:hypothetical protein EMIT0194MI4_10627 [Pseudomonas sp. IT-194MI4]
MGFPRAEYSPLKSLFVEQRQQTAMIDMRMSKDYELNRRRIEWPSPLIPLGCGSLALLHAAVDQKAPTSGLVPKPRTRSRHFAKRP